MTGIVCGDYRSAGQGPSRQKLPQDTLLIFTRDQLRQYRPAQVDDNVSRSYAPDLLKCEKLRYICLRSTT